MSDLSSQTAIWGAWRALQSDATNTPAAYAAHLRALLDQGVGWIDHADIYEDGRVESLHGEALTADPGLARDTRVITKCGVRFPSRGQPGVRVPHYRSDGAFIRASVEGSLKRLGVERIDLFLLHRPDYLTEPAETGAALDDLIAEGKIAAAGVSNFPLDRFDSLAASMDQDLAAHQIELSVLHSEPLDDGSLLDAQMRDLPLLAWSPLGGGALFGEGEAAQRVGPLLDEIAARMGLPGPDAAALAWVKRCPGAVIPILGSSRLDRLRDQLAGLRAPAMEEQDWYALLQAGRGARIP